MKLDKEERVKDQTYSQQCEYWFTRVKVIRPKKYMNMTDICILLNEIAYRFVMFDHFKFISGKKSDRKEV